MRGNSAYDTASLASPVNTKRIDLLFDKGLYDLPNGCRPACHRDGNQQLCFDVWSPAVDAASSDHHDGLWVNGPRALCASGAPANLDTT